MKTAHPPTPEELWGDTEIPGWKDPSSKGLWDLWLKVTAVLIFFADQVVIDRVGKVISETIAKAKSGELPAEEALKIISPSILISNEEWGLLNRAVRSHGRMIGEFLYREKGQKN
jgi:hypothetical protein